MVNESPFRISVYDSAFVRQGWIGNAESVAAKVEWNGIGSVDITLGIKDSKLGLLMQRGNRVVVEYYDEFLLSGPVRVRSGKGPFIDGTITFTIADDFRLFSRITGWPAPASPIGAQPFASYDLTGPAETVLKDVLLANAVTRLGEPVTIEADLGRGAEITTSFRFHPLKDVLFPAVETAGLGVTVRQSGAGLLVECHEPVLYPRILTEASGVVQEWTWTSSEAEATDVVIGADGDGVSRVFAGYADETRAAALGERVEVFVDSAESTTPPSRDARAAQAFAETDVKSGISVRLAETNTFRYGGEHGLHVGDRVQIEVGPGIVITDTLRSVTLDWTRDAGMAVVPAIGEITNNPDQLLAAAIAKLAVGVRDLRRH
jgi:hypothetical protein